ncbi:MAG TPA: hypothetical protein PKO20_04495, partial [Clostridiales bacterium]|nr:hypothetical protein [Clostridiales bacterium]
PTGESGRPHSGLSAVLATDRSDTRRPSNPPRPRGVSARMGDTVVKSAAEPRHRQGDRSPTQRAFRRPRPPPAIKGGRPAAGSPTNRPPPSFPAQAGFSANTRQIPAALASSVN